MAFKRLSANHYWRIIAAGTSYVVFAIGAFFPVLHAVLLKFLPLSEAQRQQRIRKTIQRLCKFYVNFMQFLGLMSYQVTGQAHSAFSGKVVVANHSMLIDALFVLAYIDNICCVVKAPLFRNPVTRLTVKLAGYIPNNEEDVIAAATAKLAANENILIFPEGTRNQSDEQLNFKRGAANIAIQAGADLVPIVILCQPRALQKHEKWYQLPTVKSNITVRIDAPLSIAKNIDTNLPRTIQYRRLTQVLKQYYAREIQLIKTPSRTPNT